MQAEALVRGTARHLALSLFEALELTRDRVAVTAGVDWLPGSRENLDRALSLGRGVLWLTGHVGNWELMAAATAATGIPTASIVGRGYDSAVDRFIGEFRASYNLISIFRDDPKRDETIRGVLENNGIIGVLFDQGGDRPPFLELDFLGAKRRFPLGAAGIAAKYGSPTIVGTLRRVGDRHQLFIEEPILPDPTLAKRDEARRITTLAAALLEKAILRAPEQWIWFYRPRGGKNNGLEKRTKK